MTPNKTSSSPGSDDGQFDKTLWSLILGAVQSRAPCAQKALAELCGLYWRPLYAFARRRGHSPEDAQDLVQGLFERLIGSRGLADSLRDRPVFFVELNKHGRLGTLLKFDIHNANIRKNKRQWR